MNLDEFIENVSELGLVALESDQLKEINGGIGGPAAGSTPSWKVEAAHMYYIYGEGCYSC
ncbi:hypothetical protein ACHRV1_00940 [Flavobacterium aquidurense]|uniref:hypothetical protein n=1 Tax=Flavobacterium aquidurense TaxID=362413 RepID=UPI00375791DB